MVRAGIGLLGLVLTFAVAAADEPKSDPPEPPVRLKKKEKPQPPEAREQRTEPVRLPDPKDPKDPPEVNDPEQDPAEILGRVAKNMRTSEERLATKDTREGTRQIQRDILKDLDALIAQTKRQQQQQQASNSSRAPDQRNQRQQREQMKEQIARRQMAGQQNQPRDEMADQRGGGTKRQADGMNKIADLYKDVWGHLPETLRQEMDQYAREKFMAKYNDLLKQYYATIAAKGHRKGE